MANKIVFFSVMILIGLGVGYAVTGGFSTVTGNVVASDTLSGTLLAMDPDREMAGAPCHYMANMYMGDCNIREIHFESWQHDSSQPTITVRTGELVRIKATGEAAMHGIAIPEINFDMQMDQGETAVGEFIAPESGEYVYGCSVNCDEDHDHKGKLIVIT